MGQSSNVAAASKHHLPGMPTRVHSTGTSRPTQAEGLSTVVPATQVSCLRLRKEIRAVLMVHAFRRVWDLGFAVDAHASRDCIA